MGKLKVNSKAKNNITPIQETNFDMVRNMNDAELAFFIVHKTGCDLCDHFKDNKEKNCTLSECDDYWLKWGKAPATPILTIFGKSVKM